MTLNMPQTNQRLDTAFDIQPTTKITNNDNSIMYEILVGITQVLSSCAAAPIRHRAWVCDGSD